MMAIRTSNSLRSISCTSQGNIYLNTIAKKLVVTQISISSSCTYTFVRVEIEYNLINIFYNSIQFFSNQ